MRLTCDAAAALAAYLRRLELSIDRTYFGPVGALRDYLRSSLRPSLLEVAAWLEPVPGCMRSPSRPETMTGIWRMLRARYALFHSGTTTMTGAECSWIADLLRRTAVELDTASIVDPAVLSPIRLELRVAGDAIARWIPSASIRNQVNRVGHVHSRSEDSEPSFAVLLRAGDWLCENDRQAGRP